MKKNILKSLMLLIILLLAIVLGKVGGDAASGISWLSWVGVGTNFGLEPTTLDLYIVKLTFGITINVNILQGILILLGILFYFRIKIHD